MKKLFTALLVLLMVFSLTACGKKEEGGEEGYNGPKIGVILVGDENEGYTYAHILGIREAAKKLEIPDEAIIWKYNVPEDQTTYDMAIDLVENGATLVISNSYAHQSFMQQAAGENPEVTFVALTGDNGAPSGLNNLKNAFPQTYESRYVSGVVAGMKIKELADNGELVDANFNEEGKVKVGYVGAFPYAEVVSGYTAFYLGIRSVYPDVTMYVEYTNSWFDLTAEATVGDDLMSKGCVIIGQHADSTGAPSRLQGNMENNTYGFTAYSVGYNVSMLDVAPDVALTSAGNVWEKYYTYAFQCWKNGEEIMTDWSEGYKTDAVEITPLGKAVAEGTQEAVDAAVAAIKDGTLHVFDASTFTIDGQAPTSMVADAFSDPAFTPDTEALIDGYFHESEFRSAPYFSFRIDGIVELSSN
ncbi:MAG: BMP family ABC transporter substrate-binding protein, partial [Erysipelotrichaceae bacterium]|nr:BMP family ABC transporter substrate-binding protein [Erysipelotrichaceae bacterium]